MITNRRTKRKKQKRGCLIKAFRHDKKKDVIPEWFYQESKQQDGKPSMCFFPKSVTPECPYQGSTVLKAFGCLAKFQA